jgi:hypothetical protein
MGKIFAFAVLAFLALGALHAVSCAADSYRDSCSQCSFDAAGKMDKTCYTAEQAKGTACFATSFPIMNMKYAQGNCSAVDDCISQLNSCKAQYSSGNDKNDCSEGSVSVCFAAADSCMQSSARKCGEIEKQCPGSSAAAFVLPLLAIAGASLSGRRVRL